MDLCSEQWIQAPITPMLHPHDEVPNITSPSSSSSMILSSNMSPRSSNMGSKSSLSTVSQPVITKRRSRASKKTPITLLNANASNFRALVQQFTGCPTTPLSLGVPFKGPITLNFQRGRREMQIHHHTTTTTTGSTRYYNDNKNNNNQVLHVNFHQNQHQQHQKQQQYQLQQQQQQQQQLVIIEEQLNADDDHNYMMMEKRISSCDLVDPSGYSSGASSPTTSSGGLEVSDDLTDFDGLMDDFSLHDLIDMNNAFSNDLGYFV